METFISLYLLPKLVSPKIIIEDLERNDVKLVSNIDIYHIYSKLSNYLRLISEDISQFLIHEDICRKILELFNNFLITDEFKFIYKERLVFDIFQELIPKYFHESKIDEIIHDRIIENIPSYLIISNHLEFNYKNYFITITFASYSNLLEINCYLIDHEKYLAISGREEIFRITLQRNNEDINKSLIDIKFYKFNTKKVYYSELKSRSISYVESLKYKYSV